MGKKVLYSPLGITDPIANFRDGSMLHICRIFKPDVVYLMMSKEICEFHHSDNRYFYCIEKLSETIGHKIIPISIEYDNLVNVNMFEPVYECISKDIEKIRSTLNDDDILYVNVSSGTPAMKYCLQIISAISDYHLIPVIVSTPAKSSNEHGEDKKNYDYKGYWENNDDNEPQKFEVRAKETTSSVFYALLNKIAIKNFISNYNYSAALELINMLNTNTYQELVPLLKAAQARLQRNINQSYNILINAGFNYPFVRTDERFGVFEYALEVGIKLKHHEYNDFVRSITPLMTDLYERTLNCKFGIKLNDYVRHDKDDKNKIYWDLNKLEGTDIKSILEEELINFNAGIVYNIHLVKIIKNKMEPGKFADYINKLSNVEEKLRNRAAHTMIAFDREKIKSITKLYPDEIFNNILGLMSCVNIPTTHKNSYDEMNKLLLAIIE